MERTIERRRTIRIRRSSLLKAKLDDVDRPSIKIADTLGEFNQAFRLIYREYAAQGYVPVPQPDEMLYGIHNFLPKTCVFVFKSYLEVISTMTYIPDHELFGLPMDELYKDELDALRSQGRKIVELGNLATVRGKRWRNLLMMVIKAMFEYARMTDVDDLCIMVNPKHVDFYKSIFMFEDLGPEKYYGKVKAPAVALHVDFNNIVAKLARTYSECDFETDLHAFFTKMHCDPLAVDIQPCSVERCEPLDYSVARHLLINKPELLYSLTTKEQYEYFEGMYHKAMNAPYPVTDGRVDDLSDADGQARPLGSEGGAADHGRKISKDGSSSLPGVEDRVQFQDIAFARNIGIISLKEQDELSEAVVCIPGLGGVGGLHLISLARLGLRRFRLADPDTFDLVNFNRQYGATIPGLGEAKIEVMHDAASSVNPFLDVEKFPGGLSEENLYSYLQGADAVVDGLDFFEFPMRRKLFTMARELNIPVVTAGPLGFGAAVLVFTPDSMSFDEYFDIRPGQSPQERFLRFGLGLAPKGLHLRYMDLERINLGSQSGPSTFIACQLCAAYASMELLRLLLGKPGGRPTPKYLQIDPFRGVMRKGRLRWGNRGPLQRTKIWYASHFLVEDTPPAVHGPPEFPDEAVVDGLPSLKARDYVMLAGLAAPSGDNVQPWKLMADRKRITLYMDGKADQSFFNVRQIATLVSCGAVLENMRIAAAGLGLGAKVRMEPESEEGEKLAGLEFTGRPSSGDPLHDAVWKRTTNRRMYHRTPLPQSVLQRLEEEAKRVGEVHLHFVGDRQPLAALSRVVARADTIRTSHQGLHEHFMSMVRFTREEVERTRDGLPLCNLQAGRAGEVLLRALRSWPRMRLANMLGAGRLMARHSAKGILNSGAAVLITTKGYARQDFVRGGRALQRCWLRLTQLGLAVQPMTAVTLFRLRWALEGPEAFPRRHRKLLEGLWPDYEALFPSVDFTQQAEVMLLRIGHAKPITCGTKRRHLSSFII